MGFPNLDPENWKTWSPRFAKIGPSELENSEPQIFKNKTLRLEKTQSPRFAKIGPRQLDNSEPEIFTNWTPTFAKTRSTCGYHIRPLIRGDHTSSDHLYLDGFDDIYPAG